MFHRHLIKIYRGARIIDFQLRSSEFKAHFERREMSLSLFLLRELSFSNRPAAADVYFVHFLLLLS